MKLAEKKVPAGDQQVDDIRSWPERLAALVASRGDAFALRWKSRGLWRSATWTEVGSEVDRLADGWSNLGVQAGERVLLVAANRPRAVAGLLALQSVGAVPVIAPADAAVAVLVDRLGTRLVFADDGRVAGVTAAQLLRARGPAGALAGDARHAGPVAAMELVEGEASASLGWADLAVEGAFAADDLVVLAESIDRRAAAALLGSWLCHGFTLALPESAATIWSNLREVRPTVLAGGPDLFSRLRAAAGDRLGPSGSWRRRVTDRALAPEGTSALARALVVRPLRAQLGLARVRQALLLAGGSPAAEARAFLLALGIPISGTQRRLQLVAAAGWS